MDVIANYWWLILIAAAVVALLAFVALRPRQRVRLSDNTPVRPHMATLRNPAEGRGIAGEAAAAASDVTGEIIRAAVHKQLDDAGEGHDDLCRLKGVGPRFAEALQALGFTRYEQLAGLSPTEVERLDRQLGAFRGRLTRDRVIEQADYLGRNDIDGYEQKFGRLTS